MSDVALKVENLYKRYRLGSVDRQAFKEDVISWWAKMRGKPDPYEQYITSNELANIKDSEDLKKLKARYVWALQDINFEIKQGEIVGVIGKNGAGKSTLLKILSKTTTPTKGQVKINGRIASLLEVGTGFHGELTGKENIYLNGAILGMNRHEIKKHLDEIIDFAGIDAYIDTPVKRYSSGMYVRLAFAVGAHLLSDILIVDEVLAVGDAEFQKKCIGKMQDVSKGEGKTVLFVSHNMGTISKLCNSGVLLKNGNIQLIGNIQKIIQNYFSIDNGSGQKMGVKQFRTNQPVDTPIKITDIFVKGYENIMPKIGIYEGFTIVVRVEVVIAIQNANISLFIYNSEGLTTDIAFSWDDNFFLTLSTLGIYDIEFKPSHLFLPPNKYSIGIGLNQSTHTNSWDSIDHYPIFEIENKNDVTNWEHRPWAIHHLHQNKWDLIKHDA